MGCNQFSPRRRPLAAKDPSYMLSALIPVLIYRLRPVGLRTYAPEGGLNLNNISVGDGPFSDGNGQHIHCITEKAQGRQL